MKPIALVTLGPFPAGNPAFELQYDSANNRLTGVYDQVVAKQTFEVGFARAET